VTAGGILDPLKPPLLSVNGKGDESNAEEKEVVLEALEELWPSKTEPGEENIDAATGLFAAAAAVAVAPPKR
jgi:hypothetical protein